jgi:predicted NAD/FAD-binding protein
MEAAKFSMERQWNRRQVLRTLAGVAGLPLLDAVAAPKRKVGVIGGGMAGVSVAFLLNGKRDVVLMESANLVGGNVQSIPLELNGNSFVVDLGAQYFHPKLYPTYMTLLTTLELLSEVYAFPASITLESPGEATPRFVSPILPGRSWPLLAAWNWAGTQAFNVAFTNAKKREEQESDWDLTMEAWLQTLELSQAQRDMILAWAASLFTGSIEQSRNLSARAAMIFAAKALPEKLTDPILYYIVKPGMAEVLRRMINSCTTVDVRTNALVTSVSRNPQAGFDIQCANGQALHVDDLVFASSGPSTLNLLTTLPGTSAQQAALQGIEFSDAHLAIHTDPIYASPTTEYRSFFNAEIQNGFCEASMWMANLLPGTPSQTASRVWKSWITHRSQPPTQILAQTQFRHMVPTTATLHAQQSLRALQGQGGLWFAGGYTRHFDSQESALISGIEVTQHLLSIPG